MSLLITLSIATAAAALGVALAYLPMRLLTFKMAKNFREYIHRQTERRHSTREGTDRRKLSQP